jgi:hypothetical protein
VKLKDNLTAFDIGGENLKIEIIKDIKAITHEKHWKD